VRAEIAAAVTAGLPLLTAVPEKCYNAWAKFTGGFGTTLVCERRVVEDWWREVSLREKRARVAARFRATSIPLAAAGHRAAFHRSSLADHHVG
jgi:hypothetical protein